MRSGEVLDGVVRQLRRQLGDAPTDGELLAQFAGSRDEAAFAALVRRHGGLVFGVARRQLGDRQSAEDIFQTTFLALARQAARLGRPLSLVNWLYTVALREARNARLAAMRRAARHDRLTPSAPSPDPLADITARELVAVIDDELARLPERYRLPLLLCAVEGLSREEAAARLGWSPGAVKGRLERGRERLRMRLEARGLAVPAVMASLLTTDAYAVPAALIAATNRAAVAALSIPAAWGSLKLLTAFAALFTGVGTIALVAQASRERERPEVGAPQFPAAHAPGSADPTPRVDREGVPLPPEVLARIGSSRMRHASMVISVAFAPNGKFLATRGLEGVRVWDANTGRLISKFDLPTDNTLTGISYSADGWELLVVTNSPGAAFRSLDPLTGKERRRFELGDMSGALRLAVSPSGRRFAVGRQDSSICLHESASGKEALRIAIPAKAVSLDISPDDKFVAVADFSDTIRLYDTTTGRPRGELRLDDAQFGSVTISPDGRTLASLHGQRTRNSPGYIVGLWDLPSRQLRRQLAADNFVSLGSICFSPDGQTIVTGSPITEPVLWDAATGREVRRFRGAVGAIRPVFSPDGRTLAAGTNTTTVVLWDVATGRLLPASAEPALAVRNLRFADQGRRLIVSADRVIAWDPATGRELRQFPDVSSARGWRQLSPDERLIAVVTDDDGAVQVLDATTGRGLHTFRSEKPFIFFALAFTPDSRRLIASGHDNVVTVFDLADGRVLHRLTGHAGFVDQLVASPDGRWLATASADASARGDYAIRLWDFATGREVKRFTPRRGSAFAVAFSPDARWLVSVGGEPGRPNDRGEVQLWDVQSGKEVRSFEGHTERVNCVAISPDARMLATGSGDNTLRLWETATGRERHRFTGHTGYVNSVAFAPDGRSLAAASAEAPVYVWHVLGLAEAGRTLTPAGLDQVWTDLAAPDAKLAFQAIRRLAAAPELAIALLKQRLIAAAPIDAKQVHDLIRQLDSERFTERHKAATELEKLGDRATVQLRATLKDATTAEVRQALQRLLDRIDVGTPETLRAFRAVEVLEHIATPAAREHLKTLAGGQPGAEPTVAAAAALKRLENRP
jgi:RNA polymerase sigma factor (sigma-70 family)